MNSSSIRRSFLVPALGLIALAVASCTSSSAGAPQPAAATTSPRTTGSSPAHPGSTGADALAAVNPCGLLNSHDVQQLGLEQGRPDNTPVSRGCSWNKSGSYSVGIKIVAKQGISSLNPSGETVAHTTIGEHDAVQLSDVTGCNVNMEITSSSQVGVYVSGISDQNQLCVVANQYATLIEPRLPAERK